MDQKSDVPYDNPAWRILAYKVRERRIAQLWAMLDECGIRGILIKGYAAARNYPDPFERDLGDIDVIVARSDCARVMTFPILKDLGIDVHCGPRHLDETSFDELYKESISVEIDGIEIRIPSAEDHLRILCVHWLTDGGERKDRLWDIYWAVKNRPSDFDWEKCLGRVSERRQRWIICTIGLAHTYLELELNDLPFGEEAKNVPGWLTRAIESRWKSGVSHVPIHNVLSDRKTFWKQLRKRFPPNPVMATINMEGDFESFTRLHYQAGHIVKQSLPSLKRIWYVIFPSGRNA